MTKTEKGGIIVIQTKETNLERRLKMRTKKKIRITSRGKGAIMVFGFMIFNFIYLMFLFTAGRSIIDLEYALNSKTVSTKQIALLCESSDWKDVNETETDIPEYTMTNDEYNIKVTPPQPLEVGVTYTIFATAVDWNLTKNAETTHNEQLLLDSGSYTIAQVNEKANSFAVDTITKTVNQKNEALFKLFASIYALIWITIFTVLFCSSYSLFKKSVRLRRARTI